jgi:hypothetical protein
MCFELRAIAFVAAEFKPRIGGRTAEVALLPIPVLIRHGTETASPGSPDASGLFDTKVGIII